jgi:hypothetical protein
MLLCVSCAVIIGRLSWWIAVVSLPGAGRVSVCCCSEYCYFGCCGGRERWREAVVGNGEGGWELVLIFANTLVFY